MNSLTLNREQIRKISDIAADIGLVALASAVIPSILAKYNVLIIGSGIGVTLIFWIISIRLRK